jgi:hypothetical protein
MSAPLDCGIEPLQEQGVVLDQAEQNAVFRP